MRALIGKRWFWAALALPGLALMLTAVGVRIASELKHDETRCPFGEHSKQSVADAIVLEESRECEPGVTERRWLVQRDRETLELGRRRLSTRLYQGGYEWRAEPIDGRVSVLVHNPGIPDQRFNEPTR